MTAARKKSSTPTALVRAVPALRPAARVAVVAKPDEYTESVTFRCSAGMLDDITTLQNARNRAGVRTDRADIVRAALAAYLSANTEEVAP